MSGMCPCVREKTTPKGHFDRPLGVIQPDGLEKRRTPLPWSYEVVNGVHGREQLGAFGLEILNSDQLRGQSWPRCRAEYPSVTAGCGGFKKRTTPSPPRSGQVRSAASIRASVLDYGAPRWLCATRAGLTVAARDGSQPPVWRGCGNGETTSGKGHPRGTALSSAPRHAEHQRMKPERRRQAAKRLLRFLARSGWVAGCALACRE